MHETKALWRVIVETKYGSLLGGVLMRFMGRLGWDYGKISEGAGRSFLVISGLRWEIDPRLDSGTTCVVGIEPLRNIFRFCKVLLM